MVVDGYNKEQIFNYADVMERLDNDAELVEVLIDAYLNELPGYFKKLKSAAESEDYTALAIVAHTIKGSSANVGVVLMQQISASIELACNNNETFKIKDLISEFARRYDVVLSFFHNFNGENKGERV